MKDKLAINKMSVLEKETLLILVLNVVLEGITIVFPAGKYVPVRWFSISKWIALGKLMIKVIKLFRSYK
mgnify:CR=1 FL=1|tara:strand:+ start:4910 stop:5116 length:207 start_codon:yes stop_codon:yes gene_type:complete